MILAGARQFRRVSIDSVRNPIADHVFLTWSKLPVSWNLIGRPALRWFESWACAAVAGQIEAPG